MLAVLAQVMLENASRVRPIAAYFTIDFIGPDGGNAGSAPAQRREERACLLSRLRRFRLPAASARLLPLKKSSVAPSFRSWIDLLKHVSSAPPARGRTQPPLPHRKPRNRSISQSGAADCSSHRSQDAAAGPAHGPDRRRSRCPPAASTSLTARPARPAPDASTSVAPIA